MIELIRTFLVCLTVIILLVVCTPMGWIGMEVISDIIKDHKESK